MKTVQLASNSGLREIVRKAFPSYRKRSVIVNAGEKVSLHGAHWSGGSRSYYSRVNLSTGEVLSLTGQAWNEMRAPEATSMIGTAIVETGIFCGKTATMILTLHPDDFSRLKCE